MTSQTRRATLRMFAASTLISMPALAARAAAPQAPEPDAPLVALYAEWQRLDEAYLAEAEVKDPAEEEYQNLEPPLPAVLIVHPFDAFGVDYGLDDLPNGNRVQVYVSRQRREVARSAAADQVHGRRHR